MNLHLTTKTYIKLTPIVATLAVAAFFISQSIVELLQRNIFDIHHELYLQIVLALTLMFVATTLTIGVWGQNIQWLIITLPIILGTIFAIPNNLTNILMIAPLIFYGIYLSTKISQNSIKIDIITSLTPVIKALIFYFSLIAATIYYTNFANIELIKQSTTKLLQNTVQEIVSAQINSTLGANFAYLEKLGFSTDFAIAQIINTKDIVNPWFDKYEEAISPIVSIIFFTLIGFLGGIARYIYMIVIMPIIFICKKTNFLNTQNIQVEKETLTF